MPRPLLLDCDPGHDDALAILLAHGSPGADLRAITTVVGNQTLEKTTLNARRVCTVAGIDVPIAAGCEAPLERPALVAPHIHGESGMDGPSFGPPTVPVAPIHGVDLLLRELLGAPGEISLVPVGPLTNVATAIEREPGVAGAAREIVLMGGSYTQGNQTPTAEFNIVADPEAAAIVFGSGAAVTMVGLDVTHQALATEAVVARIRALGTPVGQMVLDLIGFFAATYEREFGFGAAPVHDPVAVAGVIEPGVLELREVFVAVETRGEWTTGTTVVDFHGRYRRPANARVAVGLDVERFWDLMLDALERIR
jgi:purine nucleosidase/pyrimidine-specific ribonucleoside hydrolase